MLNDITNNIPLNKISGLALKNTKLILASSVILLGFTYYYRKWRNLKNYFKKRNIPGPEPIPLFGNLLRMMKIGIMDFDLELLEKYGKVVGIFEGLTPIILINDTRILKNILIKDFSSFSNRRIFEGLAIEPLDSFMTNLQGNEWKSVRSICTPTFTSGKLKEMSKCMRKVTDNFMEYLADLVKIQDGILDTQRYGSFTLEVIASCCFGFETNSIKDPDSEFVKHLKKVFDFASTRNPKIFLLAYLCRKNIISILPRESYDFLADLSSQIIKMRKIDNIRREDFIQHMIDIQEESEKEALSKTTNLSDNDNKEGIKWAYLKKSLSNNEILSQAVLFLVAGYDTTASTLGFVSYNLAMHQDYQQKLIDEIDEALEKSNGEITYDMVNGLEMLDMIVMETLRMYSPAIRTDRVANNDYEFENIKISKGDVVAVSVWAIHHDPDVYPEPYKFIPERFNEENKKTRDSTSFLAFGAGPRNCIAMRFAILEIKMLITKMLTEYKFEKTDKTPKELKFKIHGVLKPEEQIFVKIVKRK